MKEPRRREVPHSPVARRPASAARKLYSEKETMKLLKFARSIFSILLLLSQPVFASGSHKPRPPEVIKETVVIQEDTNKAKYVVLGGIIIASIVCWYNECWKEKPTFTVKSRPGDDR